jgi:hypothetical protein
MLPNALPDFDLRVIDHYVRSLFDAGDVVSRILVAKMSSSSFNCSAVVSRFWVA